MVLIVIGILASFFVGAACENVLIGFLVAAVGVILSFFPVEGYKATRCVEEIKLIKLHTDRKCYVIKGETGKYIYAYDNRCKYDLDGEAYEEVTIRGKVKIYETDKCEVPVMKKFVTEPVRELFAIAPFSTKIEYIFQVPIGTALTKIESIMTIREKMEMK